MCRDMARPKRTRLWASYGVAPGAICAVVAGLFAFFAVLAVGSIASSFAREQATRVALSPASDRPLPAVVESEADRGLRISFVEPISGMRADRYFAAVRAAFGDCIGHCIVRSNFGGSVVMFHAAALVMVREQIELRIDGECYSGCAMAADLARPVACVTPRAVFGFHRTRTGDLPPTRIDLMAWVDTNGGWPLFRDQKFTMLRWPDTQRFWRVCQ